MTENVIDESLIQEMFDINMEIQEVASLEEYSRIKQHIKDEAHKISSKISDAFDGSDYEAMLGLLNRLSYYKKALSNLEDVKEKVA